MTIKWVHSDPLVMNGEPFCHATRLTVRNILEMRAHGLTPDRMIAEHPELRTVGIAEAFRYAAGHRDRYAGFFEADGTLRGPGYTADEAARFPEHLRELEGIVTTPGDRATSP
ncbi:MAG TPA: DUF433 domain-containing protein [Candidatus Acidoferrales bacterium]|nr:DUF433 domain-containing protein [Candidatus Acidoferrales bacterium]